MPAQKTARHPLQKISFLLEAEVVQGLEALVVLVSAARGDLVVRQRSSRSLGKHRKTKLQALQVLVNAHAHDVCAPAVTLPLSQIQRPLRRPWQAFLAHNRRMYLITVQPQQRHHQHHVVLIQLVLTHLPRAAPPRTSYRQPWHASQQLLHSSDTNLSSRKINSRNFI
jgi:hypothetical protein